MQRTIDFSTELGRRVTQQLQREEVIWLTTIGPDNAPHPRPVWFLWGGSSFLIYSQPKAYKLAHIASNPKVALNFNSDFGGNEVAVFLAEAFLNPSAPSVLENAAYMAKYEEAIIGLGMTPAGFTKDFSAPVQITPMRLRGA